MADFTRASTALAALQGAFADLSAATDAQAVAEATLAQAQASALAATAETASADEAADAALAELVAALAEIGVSPPAA